VEAKRIRTRNGEPMMFATLDDLAGTVELLVFGKALSEHEATLKVDEVVLVKGRVDHKEAGKTCLVVQTVKSFAPSQAELERARATELPTVSPGLQEPLHLRVDAAGLAAGAIDDLKQAIREYPGSAEVLLDIDTGAGTRRLRLGEAYRVQHTATLRARLEDALSAAVSAAAAG
jgi:DNA polymerase-3 subunit alpha